MQRIFSICLAICYLSLALFLTACFALPVEEPVLPPPVVEIPDVRPIRTLAVERGNVLLFVNPPTTHLPLRQQSMHFSVGGQRIRGVFVDVGDEVQTGDILAELERPYILTQLEDAQWEEEWILLHLSQLDERHEFALEQAAATNIPVDDSPYLDERERILGQLEIVQMRLGNLEREAETMVIRAPFDGVVISALEFYGVMWSSVGQAVVTIAYQGNDVFQLLGDSVERIEIGQIYEKSINNETYFAEAIDPDVEGLERPEQIGAPQPEAFFRLLGDERLTSATFSFVTIIYERADDVLMLQNSVINIVGDRVFVYVLEDDVSVLRDIEIGLVGNSMTEITYGLVEGEVIVHG